MRKVSKKEIDRRNGVKAIEAEEAKEPEVINVVAGLKEALTPMVEQQNRGMEVILEMLQRMAQEEKVESTEPVGDVTLKVNRNPATNLIDTITIERQHRTLN